MVPRLFDSFQGLLDGFQGFINGSRGFPIDCSMVSKVFRMLFKGFKGFSIVMSMVSRVSDGLSRVSMVSKSRGLFLEIFVLKSTCTEVCATEISVTA